MPNLTRLTPHEQKVEFDEGPVTLSVRVEAVEITEEAKGQGKKTAEKRVSFFDQSLHSLTMGKLGERDSVKSTEVADVIINVTPPVAEVEVVQE